MKNIVNEAKAMQGELEACRRYLHAHAEVGFGLDETKAFVAESLRESGYEPRLLGKAVVASVGKRTGSGAFLLRADMDALPMRERSGEKFACKTGNMHACGHDLHAAMLLGSVKLLKRRENALRGEVRLLFQPAEEILQGASAAIKAGALDGVKGALTLHVTLATPLKSGTLVVPPAGVSAPAADYFRIIVKGKSCHGSAPQNGVDALVAAAHILLALQEIPARELSVHTPATLTVGTLQGGSAGNAIADKAELCGTLRAFDEQTRARIKTRLSEIASRVARAFRATARIVFEGGCPSLWNDEGVLAFAEKNARALLGEEYVLSVEKMGGETAKRSGGSEDFAYISRRVPSAMLALSAGSDDEGYVYPLHHPKARFNEAVLPLGAALLAANALRWHENMPVSPYDEIRQSKKGGTPRMGDPAYAEDRIRRE